METWFRELAHLRFGKGFLEAMMPRRSLDEEVRSSPAKESGMGAPRGRRGVHENTEVWNLLVFAIKGS